MDQTTEGSIRELYFLPLQPVLFQLARDKIAFGNFELFRFGVAGQLNDFQPVPQGGMDWLKPIGRGNEEDAGKVERQIQIVVGESIVLSRVQDFQQGRGRVTAKIGADFVQFVEEDDWIATFNPTESLDNASGEGPDIGAAMAPDFGFVAHTAKGDASELAAQSI